MNPIESISSESLTDEEIIKKVLLGEKHLYEVIMRKYNRRLYRIGMSIINDSLEVEDIMQTTYVRAYEHIGDFRFKSGFSTWLTRIMINESIQCKHRKERMQKLNRNNYKEEKSSESTLQIIMNKELRNILETALGKLPEKYRLVFILREVENMSTAETMESLNISESNVKIRLSRAKEMLRTQLSGYYKTEELYDFHLTRCDRVVKNVLTRLLKSYQ
jgi:RNA polymerase sigma-70 factor (ECF subfamily)